MPDELLADRRPLRESPIAVVAVCAILVAVGILWQSPIALLILLTDGAFSALLLLVATLAGLCVVDAFRFTNAPPRWRLLLGVAFGLGALSLLTLALGIAGLLTPTVFRITVALLGVAGGARFVVRAQSTPGDTPASTDADNDRAYAWLWLVAVPFIACWLLVSTVPPGFFWAEEGRGYDVLEYHLELPKEYFQAGRIFFVPYNVYANFPSNVEMLFLDAMLLRGDVLTGAASAKILNAMMAPLLAAAAWLAGREFSRRAGAVAGVTAATVGFVAYFAGIAFVENALVFFGLMALAAVIRAFNGEGSDAPAQSNRWLIAAGVLAGLSAGCKYTAVVMVAVPLAVAILIVSRAAIGRRLAQAALFGVVSAAAFAPWPVKNAAMTGNPFFPLANNVFKAYPPGWDAAESAHFDDCHAPEPEYRSLGARFQLLWERVPADHFGRYGPLVLALPIIALVARRPTRWEGMLVAVLLVQVGVWLFVTHLYARFAFPFIIPLVVLAGLATCAVRPRWGQTAIVIAVVAGGLLNARNFADVYAQHVYVDGRRVYPEGASDFFTKGMGIGHEHLAVINHDLPADAHVLMVGDAKAFYFQRPVDYCVVFNRNPFVQAVREAETSADIVRWLQDRGYTHVLVNWSEISRLRKSRYGFPEEVNRELFQRLVDAGLVYQTSFTTAGMVKPYADLFAVPPR